MSRSSRPRTRPRRATAVAVLAAALLALPACSTSGGSDDSGGTSEDGSADGARAPEAAAERKAADADAGGPRASVADVATEVVDAPEATPRAVISTGNVALRGPDVATALFDVRTVVDRFAGEVQEDRTETDTEGEVLRSRLVVRVPAARFTEAMTALEGAADLVTSSSTSEDVTTQVLDVDIRVAVQRRSIRRIALLLNRAESIRDVVAIEAQLFRRQADLASLERQQSFLADQTAQSTITVSLERTPEKRPPRDDEEDDATGFLAGLDAGWGALVTFGVGLATFVGAVLPWTLVLALVAVPCWLLARRLRRRRVATPTAPDPA
ncbi:DUF4349 domain-containing protein [Nocardioides dongkuii]|uniref:DUF4349 domain-containing protein n=1 Tax=Nocardioides dongkuii TaxID=2760089 RepID=UPI0015F91632|nr:DUF4349 domain-containing protein [Nocardioides dongkuii]